jgi:hypothetical protein
LETGVLKKCIGDWGAEENILETGVLKKCIGDWGAEENVLETGVLRKMFGQKLRRWKILHKRPLTL